MIPHTFYLYYDKARGNKWELLKSLRRLRNSKEEETGSLHRLEGKFENYIWSCNNCSNHPWRNDGGGGDIVPDALYGHA
jgi:hypothetical protein